MNYELVDLNIDISKLSKIHQGLSTVYDADCSGFITTYSPLWIVLKELKDNNLKVNKRYSCARFVEMHSNKTSPLKTEECRHLIIAIQTNDEFGIKIGDEVYNPQPGECFIADLTVPYQIYNAGKSPCSYYEVSIFDPKQK